MVRKESSEISYCETGKSVHGSTSSPRTDRGSLKINYLAVHPERVEGRMAHCDTVSVRGGNYFSFFLSEVLKE